jgi:hypothetical protein
MVTEMLPTVSVERKDARYEPASNKIYGKWQVAKNKTGRGQSIAKARSAHYSISSWTITISKSANVSEKLSGYLGYLLKDSAPWR